MGIKPGTEFRYSGGGYTLLQLLIEDVSGDSFNDYMTANVMLPLGMVRSTFVLEDDADVAEFFDEQGRPTTHYRFSALAAASLYTTTSDLTRFLQAHLRGAAGEPPGRGVLQPQTLDEMRRPQASQYGVDIWGLGTILYAPSKSGGFVIGHDGNNAPAINTAARLNPATGDGIIVLETGNTLLATKIASEWTFWSTGNVDLLLFMLEFDRLLVLLAGGWVAIIAAAIFFAWHRRRRAAQAS